MAAFISSLVGEAPYVEFLVNLSHRSFPENQTLVASSVCEQEWDGQSGGHTKTNLVWKVKQRKEAKKRFFQMICVRRAPRDAAEQNSTRVDFSY